MTFRAVRQCTLGRVRVQSKGLQFSPQNTTSKTIPFVRNIALGLKSQTDIPLPQEAILDDVRRC
jgi:hypothetical protein